MPAMTNDNRPTSAVLADEKSLSAIQSLPLQNETAVPSVTKENQVGVQPADDLKPHSPNGPSDGDSFYVLSYLHDNGHKFTTLFHLMLVNKPSPPAPFGLLAMSILDETDTHPVYFSKEIVDLGRNKTKSSEDRLDISIGDPSDISGHLSGTMDALTVQGHVPDASGRSLDIALNMKAIGPTFTYLGRGIIPFPGGKNYEYAFPSMETKGTLKVNGKEYTVKGKSWLDREWGDFAPAKWTWISIKVEGGVQMGIWDQQPYIETSDTHVGGQAFATILHPSGAQTMTAVTIEEYSKWTSPDGKRKYATTWSVSIPGKGEMTLKTLMDGQEINSRSPIPRLEAKCSIEGTYDGTRLDGSLAFVEVGNIAPPPRIP